METNISTARITTEPLIRPPNIMQAEDAAIISKSGSIASLDPIATSGSASMAMDASPMTTARVQTVAATLPFESQLKNMALECRAEPAFPPPPSYSPLATEVMCPLCSVPLHIKEVKNEERWRL
jgi:hypothetical protein